MTLEHSYHFEAIGTPWSIDTAKQLSQTEVHAIHEMIDEFNHAYSRFERGSLVSRARATAPGSFTFPPSIFKLYDLYAQLEDVTQGAVNPLVGETLEQWGYDAEYSFRPAKSTPSSPPSFTKTISRLDKTLTYTQPALLDIGAIGKGYLVDQVGEYIALQHPQYVIDAGGDLAVSTSEPYIIGLEHPLDLTQVIGTVALDHQSICGSSSNRRSWGKGLHHIIDATTGHPAETTTVATWAIANTTVLADALATALFFTSATKLCHQFGDFLYVIMKSDLQVEHNIGDIGEIYKD